VLAVADVFALAPVAAELVDSVVTPADEDVVELEAAADPADDEHP
jgi:hypothetical protein